MSGEEIKQVVNKLRVFVTLAADLFGGKTESEGTHDVAYNPSMQS